MNICKRNNCTGCAACYAVCPAQCITMTYNEKCELVPEIDKSKCINCDACKKVCPANNDVEKHNNIACYACYSYNERETSTSGGIAAELTNHVINNGGYVCGAVYENGTVHHKLTNDLKEAEAFKGSKYVQSYAGDSFKCIRKVIKAHKVLFVGTPCQVAGIKNIIGKNDQNLFCVELVCHGGVSHKFLDILTKKENGHLKFRDGGDCLVSLNGKELKYSAEYTVAFLKALIYRDACYDCKYANKDRIADITLGDFWGISDFPDEGKGVSIVLINTKKGEELFEAIKDNMYAEKRELTEAYPANPQLYTPSLPNGKRELFLQLLPRRGFVKAVRKCLPKQCFKRRIKKIIYSSKLLKRIYEVLR